MVYRACLAYNKESKSKSPLQLSTTIEDNETDDSSVSSSEDIETDIDVGLSISTLQDDVLRMVIADELPVVEGASASRATAQRITEADKLELRIREANDCCVSIAFESTESN